jgi:hypothetical protein
MNQENHCSIKTDPIGQLMRDDLSLAGIILPDLNNVSSIARNNFFGSEKKFRDHLKLKTKHFAA